MRPVIAMPWVTDSLMRLYMTSKYYFSIRRAGGQVRFINIADPARAAEAVCRCDGLLLPGGGDVEPAYYGQARDPKCQEPNVRRDKGEMAMLAAFYPTEKPILAICRGIQLLNVFRGGTLHQDIGDLQDFSHSDFACRGRGIHKVDITPGTCLAAIEGVETELVNSMHHQAVDRLGEGLTVSARSRDGFVEAVEAENRPFCLGIQWHPEHMSKKYPRQQAIFHAFVKACRQPE